jgi:hypothetical protein
MKNIKWKIENVYRGVKLRVMNQAGRLNFVLPVPFRLIYFS